VTQSPSGDGPRPAVPSGSVPVAPGQTYPAPARRPDPVEQASGDPGYGDPADTGARHGDAPYSDRGHGDAPYSDPGHGDPGYGDPGYGDQLPYDEPDVPQPVTAAPVPLGEPGRPDRVAERDPEQDGGDGHDPQAEPVGDGDVGDGDGGNGDGADGADLRGAARPRRRSPLLVPLVLGLVVALLAALVTYLFLQDRRERALSELRRPNGPALTAAREAGRVLFSYDYRHLDDDFSKAISLTTGDFTGEYRDFADKVVKPVAAENQVVVTATVSQAGTTGQTTPDQVVALVFVDQTTTSTKVTDQGVDHSRVRMTLVERDGRWLVSKVEAL